MVMEPKYLAFRRWLYTPIIIWQGDWIPKASSHSGFSLDNLSNNFNWIDQQTDYEIPFIVHRDSRFRDYVVQNPPCTALEQMICHDVIEWKTLNPSNTSTLSLLLHQKCIAHDALKSFIHRNLKQVRGSKRPFLTVHRSLKKSCFCCWKHV